MKNQKGFTLLELALAMLVVGIIVSLLASGLQAYLQKTRIDTTKHRMNVVEDAIQAFLDVNRRYPCPARVNVSPGVANYGIEVKSGGATAETDCVGDNTVGGGGTFTPNAANPIRHGSVPVRTLNLSDEYMVDGWGNRFTYAVTKTLASDDMSAVPTAIDPDSDDVGTLYVPNGGAISMQDSAGNVFSTNTHYVLLSHGETGAGTFKLFSTSTVPPIVCPPLAGANRTLDAENCNNNNNFVITLLNSESGNTFYDDYVRYLGQQKADNVPAGAIMAFAAPCPVGWTTYTAAEGRFVIGALVAGGTTPPATLPRYQYIDNGTRADITAGSGTVQFSSTELDVNDTNGTGPGADLLPPYIALNHCIKD